MTGWDDYLRAAQRLDVVRREAAAAMAAQAATAKTARQELAALRQRLTLQRARLTDLAGRSGVGAPPLQPDVTVPEPTDAAGATGLVRAALTDVDSADAALSEVDTGGSVRGPFPDAPQAARNLAVYGAVALIVLVTQLILYYVASSPGADVAALACGATLPAIGYAVALLSLRLLYGRADRTPVLGALVSATPVAVICGIIALSAALG